MNRSPITKETKGPPTMAAGKGAVIMFGAKVNVKEEAKGQRAKVVARKWLKDTAAGARRMAVVD